MTQILAIQGAPDAPDFDGNRHIFGNDFKANATGSITGVWYYHTSSNEPTEVTVLLHRQATQALLRSKNTSTAGLTDNTWNLVNFDSAYTYSTPDEVVTISASWPSGGFVYKTGASEHSSGGLTAVIGGTGRFKNSSAAETDYPTSTSANLACPVGMEFTAGANTVTGTAAAGLGALAGASTGLRKVLGVAAAPLGALAGAVAGTRTTFGTAAAALGGLTAEAAGGAPAVVESGSWYQLLDITNEIRQTLAEQASALPVACPNDGEPLLTGPNGELFCRFDGWRHR